MNPASQRESRAYFILKIVLLLALLYLFIVSIKVVGLALTGAGGGFAKSLMGFASNRFAGLFVGILATSIIQSSSAVTALAVACVGSGVLNVQLAIPIMLGANIGTTITNSMVSLGHITRKEEFRRAFSGAIVHDIFNTLAVLVIFPLELTTGFLEKSALLLTRGFEGIEGEKAGEWLDLVAEPTALLIKRAVFTLWPLGARSAVWCLFFLGLFCLFTALFFIVKVLRSMMLGRLESFFDRYIFRTAFLAFIVGLILTLSVQSSSVTTSLVVPLVGAGVLTVEQIFPYTLGTNIGTTITAILAGLATVAGGTTAGLTLALAHLVFNIFGACIFYPLRFIPISLAKALGNMAADNRKYALICLVLVFFIIPGILVFLARYF